MMRYEYCYISIFIFMKIINNLIYCFFILIKFI